MWCAALLAYILYSNLVFKEDLKQPKKLILFLPAFASVVGSLIQNMTTSY